MRLSARLASCLRTGICIAGLAVPVCHSTVVAQQPVVEEIVEELARDNGEENDFSDLREHLDYLLENPVNINAASRDELADLLLLNDFQISSLLDYRRQTGPILSLNELVLVYGFDHETVKRIEPFITLGNRFRVSKQTYRSKQELVLRTNRRIEKANGYIVNNDTTFNVLPAYPGGRNSYYVRYTGAIGRHMNAGMIAQQDPGESFTFQHRQAGFDYLSAYLQYKNEKAVVRKVIAGSYHLQLGQGLVAWSGFSMNKTSQVLAIRKNASGIRPYRSGDENGAFRGVAMMIRLRNLSLTPFYSNRMRDARLDTDSAENNIPGSIISLPNTGLHRTPAEQATRHSVRETNTGIHAGWSSGKLHAGFSLMVTRFNLPFCTDKKPYQIYDYNEKENLNAGMDYTFRSKNLVTFGEAAVSRNGRMAGVQGIQWYYSPLVSFSVLIRHYEPDYHALRANGFSESGRTRNETGLYTGIYLKPLPYFTLSGYVDYFKFPWLTFRTDAPSYGTGLLFSAVYTPGDHFSLNLRYTQKNKEKSYLPENAQMETPAMQKTRHLRIQVTNRIFPALSLGTRLDFTRFRFPGAPSDGFLVYQQIHYTPTTIPLRVDFRYTLFGVSGYDARIYTYENDLLYGFSTPVFSGEGVRTFLLIRYAPFHNTDIGFKISRMMYNDRETVSQGNDLIPVPHATDVKMQVRITF